MMMMMINSVSLFLCVLVLQSAVQGEGETGCEVGNEIKQRRRLDHGTEHGVVMPSKKWDCSGPIVEWQYFTFNKGDLKLGIFTKVPNTTTNWQVVDFNDVFVKSSGVGSYKVPEQERIYVKPGDVLGYSGSRLKFSNDGDIAYINSFSKMGSQLQKGMIYEMRWPRPEPRTYSVRGIVEIPQISFDLARDRVDEGETLWVSLTNVGGYSHTIRVATFDGDAKAGVDYVPHSMTLTLEGGEQASFPVETIVDDIYETESKDLHLAIYWGTTQIDWTENFKMTITVTSDVPCPDYWWKDVNESITIIEGHGPYEITAARLETGEIKTIELDIQHVSSQDNDTTINPDLHQVSFAVGESTSTVSIMGIEDCEVEDDEYFILTLVDPSNDTCSHINRREPYSIFVTIVDHYEGHYFWTKPVINVGENDKFVEICLKRSSCHAIPITIGVICEPVSKNVQGDFKPTKNRIFFGDGSMEECTKVFIVQDTIPESTESFNCTIIPHVDVVATIPDSVIVNIIDDEVVSVGWEKSSYVYEEGEAVIAPVILKEGDITLTLNITATLDTATSPSDFAINPSITVTIPANIRSYSIDQLSIIDDIFEESTEVFNLTITSVSFGNISSAVTSISITDNDVKYTSLFGPVGNGSHLTAPGPKGAPVVKISIFSGIAALTLIVFVVLVLRWSSRNNSFKPVFGNQFDTKTKPSSTHSSVRSETNSAAMAILLDEEDDKQLTQV